MCRNIKTLFNFAPPATADEVRAAALQFVRKLAGTTKPAKDNQAAFDRGVLEVFVAAERLVRDLKPHGPPRDRDTEVQKAKARSALRFRRALPQDVVAKLAPV